MEAFIRGITWTLILLSALAFLLGVLDVFFKLNIMGLHPESYSRACSNLALLAIALWFVGVKKGSLKD